MYQFWATIAHHPLDISCSVFYKSCIRITFHFTVFILGIAKNGPETIAWVWAGAWNDDKCMSIKLVAAASVNFAAFRWFIWNFQICHLLCFQINAIKCLTSNKFRISIRDWPIWSYRYQYRLSSLDSYQTVSILIILFGFKSNWYRYRYICLAPYQTDTDTDNRFKPILTDYLQVLF